MMTDPASARRVLSTCQRRDRRCHREKHAISGSSERRVPHALDGSGDDGIGKLSVGAGTKIVAAGIVICCGDVDIDPTASVQEALEVMLAKGFRHLPVREGGSVVGMVSIRDLSEALAEQAEESEV